MDTNIIEMICDEYFKAIKKISEEYKMNLVEPAEKFTKNYKKIQQKHQQTLSDILGEVRKGNKDISKYIVDKLGEFDDAVYLALVNFIDLHTEYIKGIKNGQTN